MNAQLIFSPIVGPFWLKDSDNLHTKARILKLFYLPEQSNHLATCLLFG